jgi:hypothetical protein
MAFYFLNCRYRVLPARLFPNETGNFGRKPVDAFGLVCREQTGAASGRDHALPHYRGPVRTFEEKLVPKAVKPSQK